MDSNQNAGQHSEQEKLACDTELCRDEIAFQTHMRIIGTEIRADARNLHRNVLNNNSVSFDTKYNCMVALVTAMNRMYDLQALRRKVRLGKIP